MLEKPGEEVNLINSKISLNLKFWLNLKNNRSMNLLSKKNIKEMEKFMSDFFALKSLKLLTSATEAP